MRDIAEKAFLTRLLRLPAIAAAAASLLFSSTPAFSRVIDGIAIIVNKDAILVSQINEAMTPLMQEYRAKYEGDELKKKIKELRETVIEQAIDTKLILQVARQKGLVADQKDVDTRVELVKSRFPSEDVFLQALAARGVSYIEYREQVAEQVLVQQTVRSEVGAGIRVSDNEMQDYYDSHPDEFVSELKVKLAQIFLKIAAGSAPEEIERLRQKGEQLRILIEDGVSFEEIAMKYSEGPYREKGGLLGEVSPGEMLPEIEEVAFSLKPGEVSPLVQTGYGLYLLKALEVTPARKVSFEEARPLIEERITENKRNQKYKDWIKKLRQDAFIEVKI
ncbi:peptidylprolyl isomerase [Candidatus Poribacteria bacterium]|nr:peptidylprolyl isomerase [Candidatus Poribacteria bacterium]